MRTPHAEHLQLSSNFLRCFYMLTKFWIAELADLKEFASHGYRISASLLMCVSCFLNSIFFLSPLQAVMASDFAVSQFRHLTKLLLVHGHWCYTRLSNMILYFFYKNVVCDIWGSCLNTLPSLSYQSWCIKEWWQHLEFWKLRSGKEMAGPLIALSKIIREWSMCQLLVANC